MSQKNFTPRDLTSTILGTLVLGALILTTLWIVTPFLSAFLWATMIVVATWRLLLRIQARLWGKRGLATAVLTIGLSLVLVVPLAVSVVALVGNMDRIVAGVKSLDTYEMPPPPHWVANVPLAGPKLLKGWQDLAAQGPGGVRGRVLPYVGQFLRWLASQAGGIGGMVLQFLLTIILSAILYAKGEVAGLGVRNFAYRLAGPSGENAVILAANSVRGVAMGVVGTALVQAFLASVGLFICSVPGALLLTGAALMLCLAQLGPVLIMAPAVIWKFYTGDTVWAVVLLVFTLVAGGIDNVLRPYLIRKGADLHLLLIIAGVIGGMVSMGIMGIFVGPAVLAVTYTLLKEWVGKRPEPQEANAVSPAPVALSVSG